MHESSPVNQYEKHIEHLEISSAFKNLRKLNKIEWSSEPTEGSGRAIKSVSK